MKLRTGFAAALTISAAICWGDQPSSASYPASGVNTVTVDPDIRPLPVLDADDIHFVWLKGSQGLATQHSTSIAQDPHGFLCFTRDYGVARYDGYRFRVFTSQPDDRGSPLYVT